MFDQKIFIYSGITWFTGFVCLLGCFYYYFFFYNRAFVELEIEVEQKSKFKIYWTEDNQPFSEKKQVSTRVIPPKSQYNFYLRDLDNIKKLRIDPIQYIGKAKLKNLLISQPGYEPISIDFENLDTTNDIVESTVVPDGLIIKSTGVDPYFIINPIIKKGLNNWFLEIC